MAAGIQVFGSHGVAQIDGEYANLALRQKYSVVTTSAAPMGGQSLTAALSLSSAAKPVIALRCASAATVYYVDVSGGTFRVIVQGSVGTAVDIYVFGEPMSSGSSLSGFQVYGAAGDLVFDTGRKYMRVIDFIQTPNVGPTSKSYPSGKTYASLVYGGNVFGSTHTGAPGVNRYVVWSIRVGAYWSGVTMTYTGMTLRQFTQATSAAGTYNPGIIMVIDVTGY